ncbi:MAG: PucR family transcriptional regulator [Dermatophilaceae bacterium]
MSVLDAVLSALQGSLDDLAEATCVRIYSELDAYADIEPEALASAVARNLRTALDALRAGEVPSPRSLDGAAQTAWERYTAGVPVVDIVRGFRISIALIHERFVDLAVSLRLPVETTVKGSRVMWGVGDSFTTRIITEYQAIALEAALRDAQYRAAAIRRLLAGEPADDRTLAAIDPISNYAAVRCDIPESQDIERVRKLLETSGSRPNRAALLVSDGGTCLGVVATRPADPGLAVGLGPFVPLPDLARSDRIARQALRLAQRQGHTGIHSIDELGWRLAAVSRPDIWHLYWQQFVAPLAEEGVFGEEILAAVRAWITRKHNVAKAAEALTVHVNTIRYRLRRFEELCGADLSDPDDLVGVWWALELGDPETFTL